MRPRKGDVTCSRSHSKIGLQIAWKPRGLPLSPRLIANVCRCCPPSPHSPPPKTAGRWAWVPVFGAWCSQLAVESAGPGQCPHGQSMCDLQAQGRAVVPCVPGADWGTLGDRRQRTDGGQLLFLPHPGSSLPLSSGETPPLHSRSQIMWFQ